MDQPFYIAIAVLSLGLILIIVSFIGSVLPAIPGPPLALVSLFLLPLFNLYSYSWVHIAIIAALSGITIASLVLDYSLPVLMTKYFGGSKYATRASMLGILLCIFISTPLGPFAILIGPFLGAFIGELYAKKTMREALKSATGSLLGFLAGTFGKLVVCSFIAIYYSILSVQIIAKLL